MEKKTFDFSQLYIVDFFKNIGHKKNIFAIIYLLLNVVIITLMMTMFEPNIWLSILYALLLYLGTATVALSPLGEWLFRQFNGCKKITDPELLNRLQPLFDEVKAQARAARPDMVISDKIRLYIREDDSINAFAMGRRTVCLNTGLLELTDDQIKGVLGHEFGHLLTHDTDLTLLITVGNFIITAIVSIIRVILAIYNFIISLVAAIVGGDEGCLIGMMQSIASFLTTLCINGLMWLWTQLGILLVMKSSRDAEFEADAFACKLGYSEGLLSFFRILLELEGGPKSKKKGLGNIFTALSASHPDTEKRIARIESSTTPAIGE